RKEEVLHPVKPAILSDNRPCGELLRDAVRRKDVNEAEQTFAAFAKLSPDDALNHLLHTVQENTEVHRVVLPYRAWDLLDLIGRDQAHTLLRQSVRYCVRAEGGHRSPSWDEPPTLLPNTLEQHNLRGPARATRSPADHS